MAGRTSPTSPEKRAEILDLAREGKSRNDIHRLTGVAAATVSKIVADAGLSFDRTAIKAATEARQVDNAARRAVLVDRSYRRAEHLHDRLDAPKFKTLMKTRGGGEVPTELDFVPTPSENDLAKSIATHTTTAVRMEAIDANSRDKPAVDAWLDAMTGGGGKIEETERPPDASTSEGLTDSPG